MTFAPVTMRALGLTVSLAALSACTGGQPGMLSDLDWDFRSGGNTFDTTDAARQATAARPSPDANGVISYPGYQVAVARRGDTVGSVAARAGINPAELASYNAIQPNATLRDGEVLQLLGRAARGVVHLVAVGDHAAEGAEVSTTTCRRTDGATTLSLHRT